jgi:KDO2-lipid IV(A) lauroyltransferase
MEQHADEPGPFQRCAGQRQAGAHTNRELRQDLMTASIDRLIYSSAGLWAVVSLAKAVPPTVGHAAADLIARWLASRKDSKLIRAARDNQAVIAGQTMSPASLEAAVQAVVRNAARAQYDLYHYVENQAAVKRMYTFDEACRVFLDRREFEGRGLILAALHTPGFDLGLRWLCRYQWKFNPMVLTIPNPEGGRQLEFEDRQKMGMQLIPGSAAGLHKAMRYLQQGGLVMTGIDHPVAECDPLPLFFGRPAALPTHHIFLALKAHAPIVVETSWLGEDGNYHVHASPPIEMERHANRQEELLRNAEKVLAAAEGFIHQEPRQWLMFLPVWPEARQDISR